MHKTTYDDLQETIYSKVLNNGLHVALLPRPEMSKVHCLFTTNYGSIDQHFIPLNKQDFIEVPHGVAHFLEHKMFEKEDGDVFADFGKQGASANAYTSFTKTAYLFSATNHIHNNVETLLDFVQEPYFTDETVEKEKGIIAQEIKMYDDDSEWQSFSGSIKSMYSKHPVNIDIAGTVQSITDITKEDLYTCYKTFYHPENMLFFMTGNFEPEEMMHFIEENQHSKSFPKAEKISRAYPDEPAEVHEKTKFIHMPVAVPKSVVGIKYIPVGNSPNQFVKQDVLQSMCLDYICSKNGPFYEELYNEEYIDNSFSYSATLEKNFGFSMISTNTHHPERFATKMKDCLMQVRTMEMGEETFETMKKKLIGEMVRNMNSLEYVANQYTHYHFLGIDFLTVHQIIEELTLEDLHLFVKRWIQEEHLATNIVCPK